MKEKLAKYFIKKNIYNFIDTTLVIILLCVIFSPLLLLIAEYGLLMVIGVPIWLFSMVFGHLTGHGKD